MLRCSRATVLAPANRYTPEVYFMDTLSSCDASKVYRDLREESDVGNDIRLFITAELQRVTAGGFSLLAERLNVAEELTRLSDGLFVYSKNEVFPDVLAAEGVITSTGTLEHLDILCDAFRDLVPDQQRTRLILEVLTWLALPINYPVSPRRLKCVDIPAHVTLDVIDRLRSVLIIKGHATFTTELRAFHASFPQYLVDSAHCAPESYVAPPSGHALIARYLLDILLRKPVNESLRGFAETYMIDWLRAAGSWDFAPVATVRVNDCVHVRPWDMRVAELVAEAGKSPKKLRISELRHIARWGTHGYTPGVYGLLGFDDSCAE
ncbi:hypothetical protein CERSUDRAFT_73847 [Gelatoporia subvermispora B]|uniref:Uncharacterized protein n=1 Tax=Ceriporiopsis subvermispora (strain B) TaxID=914234 RepID=M2QXF8_CERS8|nr:hypothetical protein CERSUDRAFT_73847 [Gelatoporia subvermispora B]